MIVNCVNCLTEIGISKDMSSLIPAKFIDVVMWQIVWFLVYFLVQELESCVYLNLEHIRDSHGNYAC